MKTFARLCDPLYWRSELLQGRDWDGNAGSVWGLGHDDRSFGDDDVFVGLAVDLEFDLVFVGAEFDLGIDRDQRFVGGLVLPNVILDGSCADDIVLAQRSMLFLPPCLPQFTEFQKSRLRFGVYGGLARESRRKAATANSKIPFFIRFI